MNRHILIVDDEPNILNSLSRLLEEEDYVAYRGNSGQEGLAILESTRSIGVVLSDQRMPQMTGTEFLRAAKEKFTFKVRMILSGYSELQTLTEAINEGSIIKFICKPWDDDQLLKAISEAFEYYELSERNRILSQELIDTNRQLEKLNSELESKVNEKTHNLQLHIASLRVHQEALEHFPFGVLALDNELSVVLENARSRSTLTRTENSSLGLHIADALKEDYKEAIEASRQTICQDAKPVMELQYEDSSLQIHRLGSATHSIGLLLIAIPHNHSDNGQQRNDA